jgi:hypothetical protein
VVDHTGGCHGRAAIRRGQRVGAGRAGVAGLRAPDRGHRDRRAADPGSLLGGSVRSAARAVYRAGRRGRGDHPPAGGHDRSLERLPPSGHRGSRGRQPAPRLRGKVRTRPRSGLVPARIRFCRDRVRPGGPAHHAAGGVAGHHQGPAIRHPGPSLRHLVPGGRTGPRRPPRPAQFPAAADRRGRTAHAAAGRPLRGCGRAAPRADQERAGQRRPRGPAAAGVRRQAGRAPLGGRRPVPEPGDQRLRDVRRHRPPARRYRRDDPAARLDWPRRGDGMGDADDLHRQPGPDPGRPAGPPGAVRPVLPGRRRERPARPNRDRQRSLTPARTPASPVRPGRPRSSRRSPR